MLATPLEQGNGIQKRPGTLRQHSFFLREGVAGAQGWSCEVGIVWDRTESDLISGFQT